MMAQKVRSTDVLWRYDNPPLHERRRTLRIKRSGLQKKSLTDLDRPALKFAETTEEFIKSFSLVYDVYLRKNYIPMPREHGLLYNIYFLLPETAHIIAKSYLDVISNLTEIFDTPVFGLPMDAIYKKELDELRNQGRKIVELSALATPKEHRWKNIFLYLVQVMYWYSIYSGVDDICITINPRHVRYYMKIFPFEYLGPERHYDRVNAPAVALRGRMSHGRDRMLEICRSLEFDTPLFHYFYKMTGIEPAENEYNVDPDSLGIIVKPKQMQTETVQYFVDTDPNILDGLEREKIDRLQRLYPDLNLTLYKRASVKCF